MPLTIIGGISAKAPYLVGVAGFIVCHHKQAVSGL